jgi:hypothetical protein
MLLLLALSACNSDSSFSQLEPELELSALQLDFGEVVIKTGVGLTLTATNVGRGVLDFESVALSTDSSSALSLDPLEVESLDAGDYTGVRVVCAPTSTGLIEGKLEFATNDPDNPEVTVPVECDGVEPGIELDPETLWFGEVDPDGTVVTLGVTIQSLGQGALNIYGVELSNPAMEGDFTIDLPTELQGISEAEPFKLTSGQSVPITVSFQPSDTTAWDEALIVTSNDPDQPEASARILANTDYTGEEPPTVEITSPDWGNFYLDTELVTLEGYVVDDADNPEELVANWYAQSGDDTIYLATTAIDEQGFTTTTALLPVGEPTTIILKALDTLNNVGEDRVDITVWEEEEPLLYTIAGGPSIFDSWRVDDDVTIYVNNTPIYRDTDRTQSTLPPLEFQAEKGDTIRIVATDENETEARIDALYLHWGTALYQELNDEICLSSDINNYCFDGSYEGPWPNDFMDESFEITIP